MKLVLQAHESQKAKLRLGVSEKGALSIYGLRRFPITMYLGEIQAILEHAETIKTFINANMAKFTNKASKTA